MTVTLRRTARRAEPRRSAVADLRTQYSDFG